MGKLLEITEPPRRIFAVGDLHGCADELAVLLRHLEEKEGIGASDLIVFIGDFIDRGPNSKGVIDQLLSFQRKHHETVFLRGNHEDMLLDFLGYGGNLGKAFVFNGGAETFKSYGWAATKPASEIANEIPKEHLSFLLNLESYVLAGDYVFAHAGLSPTRDLRSQLDHDLFWIRDEFIHNIHRFEKVVVFGHTPHQDVVFHLPYKIGIDTGLVFGNMLSCVELNEGRLLQIDSGGKEVRVKSYKS